MLQELAYAASGRQQPAPTHVDLQQFLGLYLNHRPALQEPSDEVSQAFAALGADSATGMWVSPWLVKCFLFLCLPATCLLLHMAVHAVFYTWHSRPLLHADCRVATVTSCVSISVAVTRACANTQMTVHLTAQTLCSHAPRQQPEQCSCQLVVSTFQKDCVTCDAASDCPSKRMRTLTFKLLNQDLTLSWA